MPLLRLLRGRRWLGRSSRRAGEQGSRLDRIELRPTFIYIRLSLRFNLPLVWPSIVAILVIEHLDDLHSTIFHDAKRRKAHFVQAGIVLQIDKHLCRAEEHTSELQSRGHLVCRLLLEKKK